MFQSASRPSSREAMVGESARTSPSSPRTPVEVDENYVKSKREVSVQPTESKTLEKREVVQAYATSLNVCAEGVSEGKPEEEPEERQCALLKGDEFQYGPNVLSMEPYRAYFSAKNASIRPRRQAQSQAVVNGQILSHFMSQFSECPHFTEHLFEVDPLSLEPAGKTAKIYFEAKMYIDNVEEFLGSHEAHDFLACYQAFCRSKRQTSLNSDSVIETYIACFYGYVSLVYGKRVCACLPVMQTFLDSLGEEVNAEAIDTIKDLLSLGMKTWVSSLKAYGKNDLILTAGKRGRVKCGSELTTLERFITSHRVEYADVVSRGHLQSYIDETMMMCELLSLLWTYQYKNPDNPHSQKLRDAVLECAPVLFTLLNEEDAVNFRISPPGNMWVNMMMCACSGNFNKFATKAFQLPVVAEQYKPVGDEERAKFQAKNLFYSEDTDYLYYLLVASQEFARHTLKCLQDDEYRLPKTKDLWFDWSRIHDHLVSHWQRANQERKKGDLDGTNGWHYSCFSDDHAAKGLAELRKLKAEINVIWQAYRSGTMKIHKKSVEDVAKWCSKSEKGKGVKTDELKAIAERQKGLYEKTKPKKGKKAPKKKRGAASPKGGREGASPETQELSLVQSAMNCMEVGDAEGARKLLSKARDRNSGVDKAWALLNLGNLALYETPGFFHACCKAEDDILKYRFEVLNCLEEAGSLPSAVLYQEFLSACEKLETNLGALSQSIQSSRNYYDELMKLVFRQRQDLKNKTDLIAEMTQLITAEHPELDQLKDICELLLETQELRIQLLTLSNAPVPSGKSEQAERNRECLKNSQIQAEELSSTITAYKRMQASLNK